MKRSVIFSGPARRDLKNLAPAVARRVIDAIQRYADTDYGDAVRLRGVEDEFRLRVGDWRVRFRLSSDNSTNSTMEVIRVLPPGRAYRD